MLEIYRRLNIKPEHPRQDEMADRFRRFRRKIREQDLDRLLDADRDAAALTAKLDGRRAKRTLIKRKAVSLLKDLRYYVDFRFGRFLFRRELRRERKKTKNMGFEE